MERKIIGKKEVKLSVDIIYIENFKEPAKQNIRGNKQVQWGCRIQNQYAKILFIYTSNEQFKYNKTSLKQTEHLNKWKGTLVLMDWKT